jgi:hypothetical protein
MKQSPVISLMMLIGCFQSLAAQDKRFVEFQERGLTQTYDLSTVQMLQPGRFTIVSTQIDDADVMKLELKVLDTLRIYCKEPDGKYPAPTDLFALGPPDLPIATIDVQSYSSGLKYAFWYYPYDRLAGHLVNGRVVQKEMDLQCKDGLADEGFYFAKRASIMNGYQTKGLFDCKRGLTGDFLHVDDDPEEVFTTFVKPQTSGHLVYDDICLRVTHETPYSP